ncbi:hypothetical protein COLU111180_12600 [Cohnella lubricantis]|uniref:Uncharacterized protein n=1 Tax=Cohnella lubricantis TaxID=2163172 RepID=A0A841T9Y3_9BACL|nr:hypothetical protein [Cohnella lubricantis]MBB6676070.1 hypothetical protein [Cohnella lubricantis]MBP2118025.1 hypothetical protein [Cohnella lubricantis]
MRIDNHAAWHLNINAAKQAPAQLRVESGVASEFLRRDSVEISEASRRLAEGAGRELPEGVVHQQPAKRFFSADLNGTLDRVLGGQSAEVREAVDAIIDRHFVPDGSDAADEGTRKALLELGLTEAQYIADNYLSREDARDFLAAMNQIAAYASTGTMDPSTGRMTYTAIPQKPLGAPDDYVAIDDLMKTVEPDTYERLAEAVRSGSNGEGDDYGSILIDFANRAAQNPKWTEDYLKNVRQANAYLNDTIAHNRFEGVDTSGLDDFLRELEAKLQNAGWGDSQLLQNNLKEFARLLDGREETDSHT